MKPTGGMRQNASRLLLVGAGTVISPGELDWRPSLEDSTRCCCMNSRVVLMSLKLLLLP